MLIYGESGNHQFGGLTATAAAAGAAYKTSHNRLQSATRVKALKRGGQRRKQQQQQRHKVKRTSKKKRKVKAKKVRKHSNGRKSKKNLSIKNVKFLKTLGFKVKKH